MCIYSEVLCMVLFTVVVIVCNSFVVSQNDSLLVTYLFTIVHYQVVINLIINQLLHNKTNIKTNTDRAASNTKCIIYYVYILGCYQLIIILSIYIYRPTVTYN